MSSLPPELIAARSTGEALRDLGLPWGQIILDWFDDDCEGSLEARLGLSGPQAHGQHWSKYVKQHKRDLLLREAAKLLRPGGDLPKRLRRSFHTYREKVWPGVRGEPLPPPDHDEIDTLFFKALTKWPHNVRTGQVAQILRE